VTINVNPHEEGTVAWLAHELTWCVDNGYGSLPARLGTRGLRAMFVDVHPDAATPKVVIR
jgi:hypothetical protein